MNIFKDNPLKIIEETHQMVVDLPSTTQLINLLYPFDIDSIPSEFLKMGQDRGICVHKQIEEYILHKKESHCPHNIKTHQKQGKLIIAWYQGFIDRIEKEYGPMEKYPEMNLFCGDYRGSIDLILLNDTFCFIIDWKTTKEPHLEKENLQTFMYKKLVKIWLSERYCWNEFIRLTYNPNIKKEYWYIDNDQVIDDFNKCLELYRFS